MKIARTFALFSAVAAVLAFAAAAGCQPNNAEAEVPFYPGERQGEVTLYRNLQFDDIPVPAEYTLVRNKSHSFQGSRFRSAVYQYEGFLDWSDAVAFYREQTPLGGWTLDSFHRDLNFVEMRYRKGPEQLIIVVRYEHFGSRTEIQLDNIEKNDLLLKGRLSP